MKKLITVLVISISFTQAQGQYIMNWPQIIAKYGFSVLGQFNIPHGLTPKLSPEAKDSSAGALFLKVAPGDTSLHIWTGVAWVKAGGGSDVDFIGAAELDTLFTQQNIAAWGNSLTEGYPAYPYPEQLSRLSGRYVYNGGISGQISTQIKDRMIAATDKYSWPTIIWAGQNNYSDTAIVLADIATMVAALGHQNYVVLSVLNGNYPVLYKGTTGYNRLIRLNDSLATIYGDRFLNLRNYLVSQYNPSNAQDVIDYDRDIIPSSFRVDEIHMNKSGYDTIARFIYNNGMRFLTADTTSKILTSAQVFSIIQGRTAGAFKKSLAVRGENGTDGFVADAELKKYTFTSRGRYSNILSNILTNGDFSSGLTGWTATGWTDGTGKATHSTGNTSALSNSVAVVISYKYRITFTVSGRTAGGVLVSMNGQNLFNQASNLANEITSNGNFVCTWPAISSASVPIAFTPTSDFNGSISNIQIQRITTANNHSIVISNPDGTRITFNGMGDNIGVGDRTFEFLMPEALDNTAFGAKSMYNFSLGNNNSAFGSEALLSFRQGNSNTAIGRASLRSATTTALNTSVGADALRSLSIGRNNTAVGAGALFYSTTSSWNTALGSSAGEGGASGALLYNIFVGARAAVNVADGAQWNTIIGAEAAPTLSSGVGNTIIGRGAGIPIGNGSNQLVISNVIYGTGVSGTQTNMAGSIGIKVKAPSATLHVGGNFKIDAIATAAAPDSVLVPENGEVKKVKFSTLLPVMPDSTYYVTQTQIDSIKSNIRQRLADSIASVRQELIDSISLIAPPIEEYGSISATYTQCTATTQHSFTETTNGYVTFSHSFIVNSQSNDTINIYLQFNTAKGTAVADLGRHTSSVNVSGISGNDANASWSGNTFTVNLSSLTGGATDLEGKLITISGRIKVLNWAP